MPNPRMERWGSRLATWGRDNLAKDFKRTGEAVARFGDRMHEAGQTPNPVDAMFHPRTAPAPAPASMPTDLSAPPHLPDERETSLV